MMPTLCGALHPARLSTVVWGQAPAHDPAAQAKVGAEPSTAPTPAEEASSPATSAAPAPERKLTPQRREAMNQALELLIWVLVLGFVLILATMWTGIRWRRRLRETLPPVSKPDELWFLKHPPKKDS
jgi:hypothetical protein